MKFPKLVTKKPGALKAKYRAIAQALQTAEVDVTVTEFVPVLTTPNKAGSRGTGHTIAMPARHSQVRLDGDRTTLLVKPGGATIRFQILPAAKDPDRYFPLGIAFEQQENSNPSALVGGLNPNLIGRRNFEPSRIRPENTYLYVTDSFDDQGRQDAYKFSIVIQRESDGAIGIIDPVIGHEPN